MLYTSPDFNGALFNFRIFFKLGAPTCLGPGASWPPSPPPPPLGGPIRERCDMKREIVYLTMLISAEKYEK